MDLLREAARISEPDCSVAPISLTVGATLFGGRLHLLRRIGEGATGIVFEVADAKHGANLALKLLARPSPRHSVRLEREFRVLSAISHPNVVRLHELSIGREYRFFTMELVRGTCFDRWVRPSGALAVPRLRASLTQVADALAAVHASGTIHRDLKPSNVLVDGAGRVVVLDFGLAHGMDDVAEPEVVGTPAYMAPEQAAGRRATPASDAYAIGVMLFEALTGRLPFEGRAASIMARKQRVAAPRPSAIAENVPPDLDALCTQLLARDPDERPPVSALRRPYAAARLRRSLTQVA